MEFSKNSNIVESIHMLVEVFTFDKVSYDSRLSSALLLVFCWCFVFSSFQYWFNSLSITFVTGNCFENYSSIVLLKLFHLIFIACQFTGIWVWGIIEQVIKKLYLTPTSEMPSLG